MVFPFTVHSQKPTSSLERAFSLLQSIRTCQIFNVSRVASQVGGGEFDLWTPGIHTRECDGCFHWLVVMMAGKKRKGNKEQPKEEGSVCRVRNICPKIKILPSFSLSCLLFYREQTDLDHPTKLFRLAVKIFTVRFPDCLDNGPKYAFFFTVCHRPKPKSFAITWLLKALKRSSFLRF